MLHGMLLDEYNEFFITTQPSNKESEEVNAKETDQQPQIQSGVIIHGITGKELEKIRVSFYIRSFVQL